MWTGKGGNSVPNDSISMRQLLVLLFTALLSPAIQALPGQTAALAGAAGWLSPLPALPILLLLCLALFSLFRDLPGHTGLAGALKLALGKGLGSVVIGAYLLWGLLLLCVDVRRYALRFLSTSYRNAPLGLFVVILLAAVLWVARGRLCAFTRAGEIFYLALAVALGLVLFFGLFRVRAEHVLPVWVEDAPAVAAASGPVLSVLGYGIFGAFLVGGIARKDGDRRQCIMWAATFCAVLMVLQLVCLGSFGPALVVRMDAPFFMMVKGIGVPGAFERIESVIIALWILSDLALLGLLAFACRRMAAELFSLKEDGKRAVVPIILLALLGAFFLFPDAFRLSAFLEHGLAAGNLIFGFAIPLAAACINAVKKGYTGGSKRHR